MSYYWNNGDKFLKDSTNMKNMETLQKKKKKLRELITSSICKYD